ncbi:RNA-binding protein [Corynebacterium sp. HMSC11H10]|uniref:YlxR family protein n=1 Tax=Corynebacterium sp. HMSC11H10 TaxID=1581090 RepID=UPI0008A2029A|nr:YlxR family protein [Corynebacterium sp. HMSC11H10]OFU54330.1 RNA-binding protein [Corynebacterium sp. HMSC11H10]
MTASRVTNPNSTTHTPAPTRTCIATKQRRNCSELLRIVATTRSDGSVAVVADPRRRMQGRGAWITPTLKAWEIADKRRAFGRALKVSTQVDAIPVKQFIATHYEAAEVFAPAGDVRVAKQGGRKNDNRKT